MIAAGPLQTHHERALCVLRARRYLSAPPSVSCFNRRVHALADRLSDAVGCPRGSMFAALLTTGTVFIIERVPLPVCQRARAWRCRTVCGAEECGYGVVKKGTGFGWRLPLIVTAEGSPVSFDLLPASYHDLTPVHELMARVPRGACGYADKGANSGEDEAGIEGETGTRLVPRRRGKRAPNTRVETFGLQRDRGRVERVHSQWAAWGAQRLHARTHEGWRCKVLAALFTLLCLNAD